MNKEKSAKILKYYKLIVIFIVPVFLFAIVGSVVVRNKPDAMRTTLVTAALANLIILGFITNTFIMLGIEYIRFKKENNWSKDKRHKKEIYKIIGRNTFWGIFNFFYLFFIAFIFCDVMHWLAPHLFLSGDYTYSVDIWGIALSLFLAIVVSVFGALFLSQFIKNEIVYGGIGLMYFIAFGYLAGGMFGPGATALMLIPSLLMPHAYIAHFMSAALTGGHYTVAHLPTLNGVISALPNTLGDLIILMKNPSSFLTSIYVTTNSSIWDLSVMSPWEFIDTEGHRCSRDSADKIYNSFYQLNALNIFIPLGTAITCGSVWAYMFYDLKNKIKALLYKYKKK